MNSVMSTITGALGVALLVSTLSSSVAAAPRSATGGVRVNLEAPTWESDVFWPAREATEFLFSTVQQRDVFWDFFFQSANFCDSAAACGQLTAPEVEKAVFDALETDSRLSDADVSALRLALAYRVHLPAVVSQSNGEAALGIRVACAEADANQDGSAPSNAWALLNGVQAVCTPAQLDDILNRCTSNDGQKQSCGAAGGDSNISSAALDELLVHDYVYRSASAGSSSGNNAEEGSGNWLVVFSTVGTPEARTFNAAARAAVDHGALRAVAFRHAPTYTGAASVVPLVPGFGIALDIKNME